VAGGVVPAGWPRRSSAFVPVSVGRWGSRRPRAVPAPVVVDQWPLRPPTILPLLGCPDQIRLEATGP